MSPSQSLCRSLIPSPVGELTLEASERGLRAIYWGNHPSARPVAAAAKAASALRAAERQLREYFAGTRREFSLPLDLEDQGTAFQRAVWQRLIEIPFGATASYAQVARGIGHPLAFRAVGGANRANPIPIVVPCHRVIGASGDLVGYAGKTGLAIKRHLLDLEAGVTTAAVPAWGAAERGFAYSAAGQ